MLRHISHGYMTTTNGSRGARRAATRPPVRLLAGVLLALAAALALLLSVGVDTAGAQGTPRILVSNLAQTETAGVDLDSYDVAQSFTTEPTGAATS